MKKHKSSISSIIGSISVLLGVVGTGFILISD